MVVNINSTHATNNKKPQTHSHSSTESSNSFNSSYSSKNEVSDYNNGITEYHTDTTKGNNSDSDELPFHNDNEFNTLVRTISQVQIPNVENMRKMKDLHDSTDLNGITEDSEENGNSDPNQVPDLKRMSTGFPIGSDPINPFTSSMPDDRLDPNSPNFNAKAWVQNFYNLIYSDIDHYKPRNLSVAFKNLSAYGFGTEADYQKTFWNLPFQAYHFLKSAVHGFRDKQRIDILRNFDGIIDRGELVIVLGRPGAGCSTFLKILAGQTYGLNVDKSSIINYSGISQHKVQRHFRGDVIYNAEMDVHFPHLTVGQTLLFAALMRVPHNRVPGVSREEVATRLRDVIMAMFGLSHTINTKVGDDFVRGVSGGERKRVSIAEVALAGAPLQMWDNSTRGLDSATAIEFIKTIRLSCNTFGSSAAVAIYQAPQSAYDLFHKAIVLYEGREIYFGPTESAKQFFLDMGFICPPRQTTADFLTSLTNPVERVVKPGYENKVPRTPDEFAQRWKESDEHKRLIEKVDSYLAEHPLDGETYQQFKASHNAAQAKGVSRSSPYTVSFHMQLRLCIWRGFRRLLGDMSVFYSAVFGNFIMALMIGSLFYNMPVNSNSFYHRGAIIFFAILFNAMSSMLEIMSLYAGRPIVDKHKQYALYRPSAENLASMFVELPNKILVAMSFNITLYFLSNLRRSAGRFFEFFLINFLTTLVMSNVFRTIGAFTKSFSEAMIPAAVFIFALVIYTGFVIPTRNMHLWARWINYLDPIAYSFETLMVNEFHSREFPCAQYIPEGPVYSRTGGLNDFVCSAVGSIPGQSSVDGDRYLALAYRYYQAHEWRNFGILIGFMFFFLGVYLVAVEINPGARSKGEVLIFQRSALNRMKKEQKLQQKRDLEAAPQNEKFTPVREHANDDANSLARALSGISVPHNEGKELGSAVESKGIFHWRDVCYDVKIKSETRRILNHVDGWVKPGTLTALMGSSGAGKTTLLDVLANRVTMGVVSGNMFVNGHLRDDSFQRSTGYVQQQDLHLSTSTVREALIFSAVLRQPKSVSYEEKVKHVDSVIEILEMGKYADAIVGITGEGLNVEQRKRLTIGVELAAKPQLLLFLDEPTSGLDSQTSWSICQLMRKLANSGQAILCTIHQPSAILMQEFDRLLFLAKGGRTVYFGDLGDGCSTLIKYFEKNGASPCPSEANPAEWMLEVIGAAPGSTAKYDYGEVWKNSPEHQAVLHELEEMERELSKIPVSTNRSDHKEFAAPLWYQFVIVTKRTLQMYSRTPIYILAKFGLSIFSCIFNGFSFFKANNSLQGLQNQMFSMFMFTVIMFTLISQMLPQFVKQRELYEVRERPAKTYSWKMFILSQIAAEIPWQIAVGTVAFFCWYYPVGLYRNATYTDTVHERGGLMYLYCIMLFVMSSSLGQACIAGINREEAAGHLAQLLFSCSMIFCGVLVSKDAMPGFWKFMYRVSPFTYFISGIMSTGLANSPVVCASYEYSVFNPPANTTCGEYMADYLQVAPGYLLDPNSTSQCSYCAMSNTNDFLNSVNSYYSERWWHMVILIAYILFNYFCAIALYWLVRVPKKKNNVKAAGSQDEVKTNQVK